MLKLMDKKILIILRSKICLSGPMYHWSAKTNLLEQKENIDKLNYMNKYIISREIIFSQGNKRKRPS